MKQQMGSGVLLWLVTISLIIFTATRTVHLITTTLPGDASIAAYFALAGLDLGVLAWLFWTTRAAAPGVQRTIGSLMIIVDLVGITAAVLGDTMLMVDKGSQGLVQMAAMWIVPIVIMANVAAGIAAHLFNPAQDIRDAEHAFQYELERKRANYIQNNAGRLSAETGEAEGQAYVDEMLARYAAARQKRNWNGNGNGQATYQKDAPDTTHVADELADAIARIEAAGGKVTRPRGRAN